MSQQALSGLKVLEFSEFVSGPYCGRLLAGLGAEVIKIEGPCIGDKARRWGPFPQDLPHPEKSGLFLFLNVNKKGVTLNVETAAGKKLFLDLVKWANVLVEDKAPGDMERLDFDYGCLSKFNPSLVMTSITGFGQTGPYRDYRACDLINTHMSGMAFGNPAEGVDDPESQPPLKQPGHTGDFMIGLSAGVCTMSAVLGQKRGGPGQHIDLSHQEALASVGRQELAFYVGGKVTPTRQKGRKVRGGILYPTKDGWVCLWAGPFLGKLVEMMGNPDWANTEIFQDRNQLQQHMDEFNALVTVWTSEHTSAEVEQASIDHGVPCSSVRNPGDVVRDEQLAFRKFFVEFEHPVAGKLKYPGAPYKLSATPWSARIPAPLLGEHNRQVYGEMLGYSAQGLLKLEQAGVI
ncbi:MAG: hypothetical protein A2147_08875 [Chloroflexi bacterium RBG_16_57_8]|nr:MAG: hypothetical protein A2147_08875 [Chloroflexi bacterium RBG_16_57_8]